MTGQHAERSDGDLNHDMLPTISGVGESEREAGRLYSRKEGDLEPRAYPAEEVEDNQQSETGRQGFTSFPSSPASPASPPSLTPERLVAVMCRMSLQHWQDSDDGGSYSLLDALTPHGLRVDAGRSVIDLIVDELWADQIQPALDAERAKVEELRAAAKDWKDKYENLCKFANDFEQQSIELREQVARLEGELEATEQHITILNERTDHEAELRAMLERVHPVIRAAWEAASDGGDWPGDAIQDLLEAQDLIRKERVTEPCGEHCRCAEWDDFPQDCYRLVPDLARLLTDVTPEAANRPPSGPNAPGVSDG